MFDHQKSSDTMLLATTIWVTLIHVQQKTVPLLSIGISMLSNLLSCLACNFTLLKICHLNRWYVSKIGHSNWLWKSYSTYLGSLLSKVKWQFSNKNCHVSFFSKLKSYLNPKIVVITHIIFSILFQLSH